MPAMGLKEYLVVMTLAKSVLGDAYYYNPPLPPPAYITDTSLSKLHRPPALQQQPLSSPKTYLTPNTRPEPIVQVQKHFYVHVPPPDPEEALPQRIEQRQVLRKHYKIIFVKVPTFAPVPQRYVAAPQVQEKTLVYVLVKKPEEQVAANQEVEAASRDRPEVYFIKYKGQDVQAKTVDDDSVVVDSALVNNNGGYRYDRPGGVLK